MNNEFTIDIYRAQNIIGSDKEVPKVTITIYNEIPEHKSLIELASIFEQEADLLFHTLTESLPGGVIDQLLGKLLAHRASLFTIPLNK